MDIDLPITVQLGRKHYALNLNFYRNAHYYLLNQMKVAFAEQIKEQIDKFFCDALVSEKKLEDDNYTFLTSVQYQFGSIDKENPRVTVSLNGEIYADHPGSE